MRKVQIISLLCVVCCLLSCNNSDVSLGTVKHYPKFLWVDAKTTPVTKTFDFEFSEDARMDKQTFVELSFVDNQGTPISEDIMQVSENGVRCAHNIIRAESSCKSKTITFTFTPQAKNGKHQGYLRLKKFHHLDRLDSQPLSPGQVVDAFQWTLTYEKTMNPLAKILMWIFIIVISCLFIWFVFLRPMFYPHFGKFTKSILIEQDGRIIGQSTVVFKGARKVVFADKRVKQSLWNRIFVGEIKTFVNPAFKDALTFTPRKKDASVYGKGYIIRPNPIQRSGVAQISNNILKTKITLR